MSAPSGNADGGRRAGVARGGGSASTILLVFAEKP
ncbi:hypothetical protein HNR12_004391 [Streptomonospora nanhaiensis]|uniref:Uncharacterized protein n=1 Tax=Streptomonospora nanhaiensis TaxID=1323731 RepID=A0A853BT65_9ACTN|nr:hypothetical protein [Streptomonospora nanhaiensis]